MKNLDPIVRAKIYAASAMGAGSLVFFLCLIFIMGPIIEGKYFPVVTNIRLYETVASRDGLTALIVIGNKLRDCEFLGASALHLPTVSGEPEQSSIVLMADKGKTPVSRPTGRQSFGVWEFDPGGDIIKVSVRSRCHPLWPIVTEMFTWRRG